MLMKCEQNRTVQAIQNLKLFVGKMYHHCLQSIDGILEDVLVTETVFGANQQVRTYNL